MDNNIEATLELKSLVDQKRITPEQSLNLRAKIDAITGTSGGFVDGVKTAAASKKYSPSGLADLAETNRAKALAALDAIEKTTVAPLDQRIADDSQAIKGALGTGDYNIERETRDQLMKIDPLEREQIYLEAARDGNPEIEAAVERAPRILKIVSADAMARGQDARLRRMNPEQHAALENVRIHRSTLAGYLAQSRKRVNGFRSI